jgi:hypothetical protein
VEAKAAINANISYDKNIIFHMHALYSNSFSRVIYSILNFFAREKS